MPTVVASDIYPALWAFLAETSLQKTLKAFDKETAVVDEQGTAPAGSSKKAKALAQLELVAACQMWLEAQLQEKKRKGVTAAQEDATMQDEERPKKKSRGLEEVQPQPESAEVDPAAIVEKKVSKQSSKGGKAQQEKVKEPAEDTEAAPTKAAKKDKQAKVTEEAAEAEEPSTPEKTSRGEAQATPASKDDLPMPEKVRGGKKHKNGSEEKVEKKSGVPFKRIDDDKWRSTIKDSRLMDNTHKAKVKFGDSAGDSWGDKASEDLLKVRGKGFRKEMAKKKRASWRGGGEIDQGVNSVKLDDSSDEE